MRNAGKGNAIDEKLGFWQAARNDREKIYKLTYMSTTKESVVLNMYLTNYNV